MGSPFLLKYRLGHISEGCTPSLSAIILSPLGHRRINALDSVDELSPDSLDNAASVVPRLRNAAIISAGCQSF